MRWSILAAIVLLALVGFASAGRAEEADEPRWYFGTRFGHGLMLNRRAAPGVDVSRGAPASGVFAGLNLNRYLGIELAAEFFEIGLAVPGRGTIGEYGMFSLVPQARVRYPLLGDRLMPYVTGGIGVGRNEFNDRKPPALGLRVRAEGTALVGAVGGGIEYLVADNIAVGTEIKLLLSRDQQIEVDDRGGRANLDALLTTAHLRLRFPDPVAPASWPPHPWWRPYIGLRLGGAIIAHTETDPDLEIRIDQSAIASKANHLFNVAVGMDWGRYTGLELSVDGYETNVAIRGIGVIWEYAIYVVVPQFRLRYPLLDGQLVPYLLGGVGFSYAEANDRKPPGFNLKMVKTDYALAASLGAGIDWFIARNVAVGLETKYVSSRDHRSSLAERGGTVSLDSLLLSLGMRIFLR